MIMKKISLFIMALAGLVSVACNDDALPVRKQSPKVAITIANAPEVTVYPGAELDFAFTLNYEAGLESAYALVDGVVLEESRTTFSGGTQTANLTFSYKVTDKYAGNTLDFAVFASAADGAEGHYDYPVFVLAAKPEVHFTFPENVPTEFTVDGSSLTFDVGIRSAAIDLQKITVYKGEEALPGLGGEVTGDLKNTTLHFDYTPTLGDTGTPVPFTIEVMDVNGNIINSEFSVTFIKKPSAELNEYSGVVMGLNKCPEEGQFFDAIHNIAYKANGVGAHSADIHWSIFWSGNAKTIGVAFASPSASNVTSIYPAATIVTTLGGTEADIPANWSTRNETHFRELELDADAYAAISTKAEVVQLFDTGTVPANDLVTFQKVEGSTMAFKIIVTDPATGGSMEKVGLIRVTARNASNNTGSIVFDYKIEK